jgi:hypothetical protein
VSDTLKPAAVAEALDSIGLDGEAAPVLVTEGLGHIERQRLQADQREALGDRDVIELPALAEAIDQGALFELAGILRAKLLKERA